MPVCEECLKKQRKIDQLEDQLKALQQRLRYQQLKNKEGYFGSSTPSSQKPFKENTKDKSKKKNGGAKRGHVGHGRKSIKEEAADEVEYLKAEERCPGCNGSLISKGTIERTVIDSMPIKAKKILYKCEKKYCPKCKKTIKSNPVVLPRFLYGNQLISQAAVMHYRHGVPVGRVESIIDGAFPPKGLFDIYHRLGKIWKKAMPKIVEEYQEEKVKHADETGWRTDGESGYAWNFCSKNISIFQFEDTRSARVPKKIFGKKQLPGVLVVDRYNGYNKVPCKIQYCYAHLLRKVEDLGKQFIDNEEVQNFVSSLAPLLSEAMHLRTKKITNKKYYQEAKSVKRKILKIINSPASHLGIQNIQMIFKENEKRLYHWARSRDVPADNNRAERELRPTVIARKVSFGSQSEKGAETRSILMTILHTAEKRLKDLSLEEWFKDTLDKIALNPEIDPYLLIPPAH